MNTFMFLILFICRAFNLYSVIMHPFVYILMRYQSVLNIPSMHAWLIHCNVAWQSMLQLIMFVILY